MAGLRLPCLRSLAVSLNGVSRFTSGSNRQQQLRYVVQQQRASSAASSVNLSSPRINDNVVYSRHEDCFLHTQSVVQRFFEQASLWPNHIAVVRIFKTIFVTFFFLFV